MSAPTSSDYFAVHIAFVLNQSSLPPLFSNLLLLDMAKSKTIVVCWDGTWQSLDRVVNHIGSNVTSACCVLGVSGAYD